MKKKDFALGILCGAMLFSGATSVAAGIQLNRLGRISMWMESRCL